MDVLAAQAAADEMLKLIIQCQPNLFQKLETDSHSAKAAANFCQQFTGAYSTYLYQRI